MVVGVLGVLYFLPQGGQGGNFYGFLAMFMLLFATSGIGNGSTFRMIPVIFMTERQREAAGKGREARGAGGARCQQGGGGGARLLLGDGAYGGFFIPKSYGISISMTGGPEAALYMFIVFYLTCIVDDLVVLRAHATPTMPC